MMRRFASALLVLLVVLAVSACGGSAGPGQPGAETPATNTPAAKPTITRRPTVTPVPGGPISGKKTLANGVWMCPQNTAGAKYVGSIQEKEYHTLDCPTAQGIPVEDRVCFLDHQVAVKFGYTPAGDCSPP
jgi:hypothetical protein